MDDNEAFEEGFCNSPLGESEGPDTRTEVEKAVEDLLVQYGGEALLRAVGYTLRNSGATPTAVQVGKIIEQLAELEW